MLSVLFDSVSGWSRQEEEDGQGKSRSLVDVSRVSGRSCGRRKKRLFAVDARATATP